MCNTCGLFVGTTRKRREYFCGFPQYIFYIFVAMWEKQSFIPCLHNFYTQFFPRQNVLIQSVSFDFYTFYTRLIITKTI